MDEDTSLSNNDLAVIKDYLEKKFQGASVMIVDEVGGEVVYDLSGSRGVLIKNEVNLVLGRRDAA